MPGRKPLFSVAAIAASALAVAAFAVSARPQRSAAGRSPIEPELGAERLRRVAGEPFFRLVRTYYQSRNFHVHHAARRAVGYDADLYFGTLPHAVAIVRVLGNDSARATLADLEDLPETMRRRGVARAIVHHTADYSAQAAAFARAHRIRLVGVRHLAEDIARLPLAARLALCASLTDVGDAPQPQRELALE